MVNLRHTRFAAIVPMMMLSIVVIGLFVFLTTISPYPAGDDPGYHSTVLRYLLLNRDTQFVMPYFPQLEQLWGSVRFVTPVFLATFATITGYTDVFRLTVGFAALSASLALIPIYLLVADWLRHRGIAVLTVAYLAFSKFYLANFFQGSFEQYTGLLFLSWILYAQYVWSKSRNSRWLVLQIALTGLLYKTHELGFFVAVLFFIVTMLNWARQRLPIKLFLLTLVITVVLVGVVMAGRTTYFAPSTIEYSLKQSLGVDEGTPTLVLAMVGLGMVIFFLKRFQFEVFSYLAITLILSQSLFLGSSFYPFRFNLYFSQAVALLFAVALASMTAWLRRVHASLIPALLLITTVSMVIPQFVHVRGLGKWITGQRDNPNSVILDDDVAMFRWMKHNLPTTTIVAAPFKWGFYIPALAERSVVVDDAIGGDSRDVRFELAQRTRDLFLEKDPAVASGIAKELGVRFVLWDASISRFPGNYEGYTQTKFSNTTLFRTIHRINKTILYEVL